MHIGSRVFRFDEIDSTNDRALQYAGDAEMDGAAFHALSQTAGRGQYDRVWQAPPGSSALLSILLFPPPDLRRPVLLTAMAAVAVGETILQLAGKQARIKWPNDLLIEGKKICGILIESRVPPRPDPGKELAIVCGIGLNLNQTAEDLVNAGLPDATSLRLISGGSTFDADAVVAALLGRIDEEYQRLLDGDFTTLEACWKWRIGLIGKPVTGDCMDGSKITGRLRDMHFDAIEILDGVGSLRSLKPEAIRHIRGV